MNSTIDCALFRLPLFDEWAEQVINHYPVDNLFFHSLPLAHPEESWAQTLEPQVMYDEVASRALAAQATTLQRFDVCLLPVVPPSLAWTRVALANARRQLPVPLLLLVRDISAVALRDLLMLGAADFLLTPFSAEELKTRLLQWGRLARRSWNPARAASAQAQPYVDAVHRDKACITSWDAWNRAGSQAYAALTTPEGVAGRVNSVGASARLHCAQDAAGSASTAYSADPGVQRRPRPSPEMVAETVRQLTAPPPIDNSYRATRARVLAQFEREYVTSMLLRYRGNVTHAARAGNQDRRAFWQLMKKYQILSADFRTGRAAPSSRSR